MRPGEGHRLGFLLRQLDDALEASLNAPIPLEHSVVPLLAQPATGRPQVFLLSSIVIARLSPPELADWRAKAATAGVSLSALLWEAIASL